jgi:asparagine synthase (glutamine-hydrolysing)
MCGIAGFAGHGSPADLQRMTDALAHRGPDAEGSWSDPERPVHLGHRRLAVVDPATGAQPMWTEDGEIGVVFNGEIYEHAALRRELEARGHRFCSHHADTEVLLHGYREWGTGLVQRLNGMWAFALYDRPRRRLWLSRDRFGQKPLYWARTPRAFVFGSELSAVLRHPEVPGGLCPTALRKYFAYGYVPAPRAVHRGVHKLPAGCSLSLELPDGEPRVTRYWDFRLEPELRPRPEAWLDELRERLERAVARRLVADVPVGVFLSGGVDSSTLAFLAARHCKPGELRTFSIGFEDASFDESRPAARVAEALGARHRCTLFSADRARRSAASLAARLDEPVADPSLLPTELLCGAARREVTVALGGDGADELFAGYDPFRALRLAALYTRWVPRPLHLAVRLLAARLPTSHRNMSTGFRLGRALAGLSHPPRLWNPVWMAPLGPAELAELLGEPVSPDELFAEAIDAWNASAHLSSVDRTLQFFTRLYLQEDILPKVDRASMLHGLEVRSPYLDIELVDLVRRMPAGLKLRDGRTKWILKRAAASWLPAEVLRRAKKGFGVPVGSWLQQGLAPFDAAAGSSFHRRRLEEHRAGRADHRLYLYAQWLLDTYRAGPNGGAPR